MPMTTSVQESWIIIERTLLKHSLETFDALGAPATKSQIAKLEKIIGRTLPTDLVDSLRIHNGLTNSYLDVNRLFDYEALLSTDTIVQQWQSMKELLENGHFDDDGCPLTKTRKIKNDQWWTIGWIPITDADGSGYCMDLDPASRGIVGQLFYFYHDCGLPREVMAPSYTEWLSNIARKLKRGKFTVDDGGIWLE
jgi:molybdopterin molybdotransferase